MEITLAIKHIHPSLTDEDFMVFNDNQGEGPYIQWYNKNIPQPTQAELETAWIECEKEIKEQEKLSQVRTLEAEMKELRANRDGIAELIEFGAEASGDRELLEQIQEQIKAKAMERKVLIEL